MTTITILATGLFTIALIGFTFGLILPTLKKVVLFILEFMAFFALILILPIVKFIKLVFRLKSI